MDLARIVEEDLLPLVDRPSRYLGNEVNSVHKDRAAVDVRLALVFPDLYDLGLGNLGLHVLYAVLNQLDWVWCERASAPAQDLEQELRSRGLPLFALESRDPLGDLDAVGITLQSELTYTNVLNVLDLARIPLRSADRGDEHPIVFAGGPCAVNPEPLAPFVDAFAIGDGEEVIVEIAGVLRQHRTRAERLDALAALAGVYVPARYPTRELPDGRVLPDPDSPRIVRRTTRDLDAAPYPIDHLIPYTRLVHDRIGLEVLRGCTHGCRFCQAGMVGRPVRERSAERVEALLEQALDRTGYEEVSLVSLSTCDHSRIRELLGRTVDLARERRATVSLPSLRLDTFAVELADMVAETRRTGLTFAPEAATPRLRAVINKWIPDEALLEMTTRAYERGWDHVKLYFMIGLPFEEDDDLRAIGELCRRTLRAGRAVNPRAHVNLGVSTFVPKPHTPLQWCGQIDLDEIEIRQDVLEQSLGRATKFGRHDPEETFIEGLISRGDRRVADLIEAAWNNGARFDAWREHRRFQAWLDALADTGLDPAELLGPRGLDEPLPWDHVDVLVDRAWLEEDWARARAGEWARDCRAGACRQCGVMEAEPELCTQMVAAARHQLEREWDRVQPPPDERLPVQRIRLRIGRTGTARFLSHLEALGAWIRALRRASAPLAWTLGFHPHPRLAFSSALPSGHETVGDYLDVFLVEEDDPQGLVERLGPQLPPGFQVLGAAVVELRGPSLMSLAVGAEYTLRFLDLSPAEVAGRVEELLAAEQIVVARSRKVRRKRRRRRERVLVDVDVRPMIHSLQVVPGEPAVHLTLAAVDGVPGKAREVAALFTERAERVRVLVRDTLCLVDGELVSIGGG